jgi:hypothetical protein
MKPTWALVLVVAAAPGQAQTMNMQEVAQALGVRCEYCHSAPRGSGQPEPKKDIALAMMAMTRDLNAKVQAATGKPANETARVECVTCHRGVAIPQPLSAIILRTVAEKCRIMLWVLRLRSKSCLITYPTSCSGFSRTCAAKGN